MENRWLIGVAVILFLVMSVSAQTWQGSWGVGGAFNIFKLWGGQVDRSSMSYGLNLDGRYGIHPSLVLGADIGYGMFKPAIIGTSTEANKYSPYRTFLLPIDLTVRYTPLPDNQVKPYVLGSLGLFVWNLAEVGPQDGNFLDNRRLRWGKSVYGTQTNLTLGFGGGFEWFVTEHLALDFEGRGAFLLGMKKDNVGEGDANDKFYQLRIGAVYYWGGKKQNPSEIPTAMSTNVAVPKKDIIAELPPREEPTVAPPVSEPAKPEAVESAPPNVRQMTESLLQSDQTGRSVILMGVNFEYSKADLTDAAKDILDQVAESLVANETVRVKIVGYTDNTGSAQFNNQLSRLRAETVKNYLISKGVSADRLETEGRGANDPIADNSTDKGRTLNRRIEFFRLN